jgi:hypothetical protein
MPNLRNSGKTDMAVRKVFHANSLVLETTKPGGWPGFSLLLIKAYQGCQGWVVEIVYEGAVSTGGLGGRGWVLGAKKRWRSLSGPSTCATSRKAKRRTKATKTRMDRASSV